MLTARVTLADTTARHPIAHSTTGTPMTPQQFESALIELALSGRGWTVMLDRLADEIHQPVVLLGVHGDTVAHSRASPQRSAQPATLARMETVGVHRQVALDDSTPMTVLALRAGSRRVGYLATPEPTTTEQHELLHRSHTALCIEAVRRDAEASARAESASRIIDEIRFGVIRDPADVVRLAARFGVALDQPHAAAVFDYSGPDQRTWSTALSWIEAPVRTDGTAGWTVLADDPRELTRILVRLRGMVGDPESVLAANGSVVSDVRQTARSFVEAEIALAFGRRRGTDEPVRFPELGLPAVLVGASEYQLDEFVTRTLGSVIDRPDLLATLDAWIACDGSRTAVTDRLHIHRNSVGYRLNRITEMTGLDVRSFADLHQLQSAILCLEVLAVVRGLSPAQQVGSDPGPNQPQAHESRT